MIQYYTIMKRLFCMVMMAVVTVVMTKVQNNELPMATLQHGDKTLGFKGVDAFSSAYAAAAVE